MEPAKIRSAACAIILNDDNELLIVKPTYRKDWLLPGGCIELNESPSSACNREIKEEIGLNLNVDRLLCFEYQSEHDGKTESLQYTFYGGIISSNEIASIKLQESELMEYRFMNYEDTKGILNDLLFQRLRFAFNGINEKRIVYIEDKQEL
jgi:8-oxo-dGTP diphosphatase